MTELLLSLLAAGVFVAVIMLLPHADPLTACLGLVAPVVSSIRSAITAARGRVVLDENGIEVRRVRTRQYPWASLSSITIDEDGYIEITPEGWVRRLPIPRSQVAEAFDMITERWNRSTGRPSRAPQS